LGRRKLNSIIEGAYTESAIFSSGEKTDVLKKFGYLAGFGFKLFFFLCPDPPGGKLRTCGDSTHTVPVVGRVEWVDIFGFMKTDLREAR
jgi:hypothetical protein